MKPSGLTSSQAPSNLRVLGPLILAIVIFVVGSTGYYFLGEGRWSVSECAYMTAITISTVGFAEVIPVSETPLLRIYTILLVFGGAGTILYLMSSFTAFLVEGQLNQLIRRRRMDKAIEKMRDHYIVCGVGRNGEHAAAQLISGGFPTVIVDRSEEAVDAFMKTHGDIPFVVGDVTQDDDVLLRAGAQHARGLIAALSHDQDNLFLVLSAKEINPAIRVVSKINEARSMKKLLQVGTDRVVSPSSMGGYRLFLQMVRPQVTDHVDYLLFETKEGLIFDEVPIPTVSALHGKRLADSEIRTRTNLLVVGIRDEPHAKFTYNPGPNFKLAGGMTLIVLGPQQSIQALREMAEG